MGGQKELQELWSKYYDDCHAIVFVVDSTDALRVKEAFRIFGILIVCSYLPFIKGAVVTNDSAHSVPVLVIANKQDDPRAIQIHELKEMLNPIVSEMSARESNVLAVSALQGYKPLNY